MQYKPIDEKEEIKYFKMLKYNFEFPININNLSKSHIVAYQAYYYFFRCMKEVLKFASFRGEKTRTEKIFTLKTVTDLINGSSLSDTRIYTPAC